MADDIQHRFERAGLGKAPYRLVAFERRTYSPAPGVTMVGGSCDYCGTGIVETFVLQSADGKTFKVGNDCIAKAGDAGLLNLTKRALNRERTKARHAREEARITAARAALPKVAGLLAVQRHPNDVPGADSHWRNKRALDFVVWMFANAGNAGKIRACKVVEQAVKDLAAAPTAGGTP